MRKIQNNIELVSLHIPKVAGTSFRNTLKSIYGNKNVIRLDIKNENISLDKKIFEGNKINSRVKVVHGHFNYCNIYDIFEIQKSTPIITWMRNPVDRVISNYYYLKQIIMEIIQKQVNDISLDDRMLKTIEEYAVMEVNRNRMSKFLKGANLEDFFFIGFIEEYEDDLNRLSQLLGWKSYPYIHHNKTTSIKPVVNLNVRKKIEELNSIDMELYLKALQLRNKKFK